MNKLLTIFGSTLIVLGLFALAGIPGMEISAQVTEYPALQTTTILVIAFGAFSSLGFGIIMLLKGSR